MPFFGFTVLEIRAGYDRGLLSEMFPETCMQRCWRRYTVFFNLVGRMKLFIAHVVRNAMLAKWLANFINRMISVHNDSGKLQGQFNSCADLYKLFNGH